MKAMLRSGVLAAGLMTFTVLAQAQNGASSTKLYPDNLAIGMENDTDGYWIPYPTPNSIEPALSRPAYTESSPPVEPAQAQTTSTTTYIYQSSPYPYNYGPNYSTTGIEYGYINGTYYPPPTYYYPGTAIYYQVGGYGYPRGPYRRDHGHDHDGDGHPHH